MPLHADLWRANRDLARASLQHPFVRGIADGSLNREAFKRYVAQDAFFLRAFLGAYALAAAKSSDHIGVVKIVHSLMGGVLDELQLHRRYADSLSIDLDHVRPYPATTAYTDFLVRTAWSKDSGEIVAAMTPCMRLYAHIGQDLAGAPRGETPYQDWIDTYASPDFAALAVDLETLLDEIGQSTPPTRAAYRYAMECELAFFSAPLEADQPPRTQQALTE